MQNCKMVTFLTALSGSEKLDEVELYTILIRWSPSPPPYVVLGFSFPFSFTSHIMIFKMVN